MTSSWKFDIYAEESGIFALLPFGELRVDIRRSPKPICKLIELAAKKAYETTYYNITGGQLNQVPKFTHQPNMMKKLRDFFMKNATFRAFINGIEKRDEKYLMSDTKTMRTYAGDRVIRKGMRERALFYVVHGEFFTMENQQTIYKTGAVLGCE